MNSRNLMDDWPSHLEELTRKTSVQLTKLCNAYDAERISKREFFLALTCLYNATSGLIAKDLMDLMADIDKELRNENRG